jgi:nucleoside-diphosphate-sugar epimerase
VVEQVRIDEIHSIYPCSIVHYIYSSYDIILAKHTRTMDTATFFVTGGSGLVWSHIVEKLIQAHPSSQVHALSRSPVNHFSGATYHACDITSAEAVQKVFDEISPTVVFHAAATGLNLSELEDNVTKINIVGTRNLVEASVKSDVKAFVFTSSMGVVQVHGWKDIWNGDETLPIIDEDSKALHYAYTKVSASSHRQFLRRMCKLTIFGDRQKASEWSWRKTPHRREDFELAPSDRA